MKKTLLVTIVGIVMSGYFGIAQSRCSADSPADKLDTQFVVSGGSVKMPVGAFLLVRKNGAIGAIRLTNVDPGLEGRSTYESYFQGNGSGSFMNGDIVHQTGDLNLKPVKGIGRLAFQTGQDRARIGKWSFRFDTPSLMAMWPYRGDQHDYGYEFAPTSACDISEVDVHDKRLRWFRFDPNAAVTLSLADLPK